jgi:adenylate cyclase
MWLWQLWRAMTQFFGRDFAASLDTLHEVVRLRPAFSPAHQLIAVSLAHLGRLPEARVALNRASAGLRGQDQRITQQRPPWIRPEDYALRVEGLRLAAIAPP